MREITLPDKVVRKIRIPVLGYNTLKFIIYLVVGVVLAFIVFAVYRSSLTFAVIVAVFLFLGFVMSIVRVNGEIDLDKYLLSYISGKEKVIKGTKTQKLVAVDSVSKDGTMLRIGGSYAVVLEATGDTVGVMSDDRATWYFDGFLQYEKQASSDVVASIIFMPERYNPSPVISNLKPRAGTYDQDLLEEYKKYLESFRNVRAYVGMIVLRFRSSSVGKRKNMRGVDMEQAIERILTFEIEKVVRNLGSKGVAVVWVKGKDLLDLGKLLYNGGL